MKKFKLGEEVKFNSLVVKTKQLKHSYGSKDSITSYVEFKMLTEQKGVVVGIRNLHSGETTYEDVNEDEYKSPILVPVFTHKATTTIYLVAVNLTRNPVKVSREHLIEYNT